MALLNETFDAATLPQNTSSFSPLPKGWYSATIAGAELKTTKNGSGQYIAVRYDIIGPTHQGRVVFGNINIRNQNIKAEEIGRAQLGDLIRSIGVATLKDTDQLLGKSVQIKLDISQQEGYDPRNEVRAFKALEGANMPMTQMPAAPQATQASASAAPPWAKK